MKGKFTSYLMLMIICRCNYADWDKFFDIYRQEQMYQQPFIAKKGKGHFFVK